jgi:tryptophanase
MQRVERGVARFLKISERFPKIDGAEFKSAGVSGEIYARCQIRNGSVGKISYLKDGIIDKNGCASSVSL